MRAAVLVAIALALAPRIALAHRPSDAYLDLAVDDDRVTGRLDLAIRDLDAVLGLDADADGAITWAEVIAAQPRIAAYVDARLSLATDASGACPRVTIAPALADHADGPYWVQAFTATCPVPPRALSITYALLFDTDPQHQLLVRVDGQTRIVRDASPLSVTLVPPSGIASSVRAGVIHVGADAEAILLLLCLIVPAVQTSRRLREVVGDAAEIAVSFVLALALALVATTSGLVHAPPRFVEIALPLSVAAAAANNLLRVTDARWLLAFALGPVFGFGFASLGATSRPGYLAGLALGVLVLVLVAVPLLYAIRRTAAYPALRWGGAGAALMLALFWAYERAVG